MSKSQSSPATPCDTTEEFQIAKGVSADFLKALLAPSEFPGDLGRLGTYRIRGILGAGGMGVVLLGEDPTLQRKVAIKLMWPEVAAKPGAKTRFLREARAAAAVQHPRVVVVHHVDDKSDPPFLVMPLMAGCSLAQRLKKGPPLSLGDAVRFVREAADGLAAAHAKGLVHRDVKPDNIWLEDTSEGTHVRLLDFGLARTDDAESLTEQGTVLGTPYYMAPEQAAGLSVDGRTDLFSLGCVLYEMLVGVRAFSGDSLMSVLNALANVKPEPPKNLAPTVPVPLSDLVMRLLEKAPEHRPQSAVALSESLRRIEQELASPAETLPMPASRSANRPRTFLWALGAMGTLFVAVAWTLSREPQPSTLPASGVKSSAESPTVDLSKTPLHVKAIDVSHFASTPQGDTMQGLLGQKTFTPKLGDRVQVMAHLSKPGYAYLIAFRPDGVADLCYPEDEATVPPLTDSPRYPLQDGLKAYGLREGTGLWVFAVVASETPLPAYRDWLRLKFREKLDWKPVPTPPAGVVWWDDGSLNVDHITAAGASHTLRGKDELLEGPAATIKRLTESLRMAGGADTASAVGFGVGSRE